MPDKHGQMKGGGRGPLAMSPEERKERRVQLRQPRKWIVRAERSWHPSKKLERLDEIRKK